MTKIIGGNLPSIHVTGDYMPDNKDLLQFGDSFEGCIDATDFIPSGRTYQSTPWWSGCNQYAILLHCVARTGAFE